MAKLLLFMFGLTCCSSCVVPVPHRRVHVPGIKGQVVDARTNHPIAGAKIRPISGDDVLAITDTDGKYNRKPVYGWHGAYLVGPISYSLFPHFDMARSAGIYRISATGYRPEKSTGRGITKLNPLSSR